MGDGVLPLERWHREKTDKPVRWMLGGGPTILMGDEYHELHVGEWLVWSNGEFPVLDDEQFRETYEEVK